jgi:hypothetical protein
LVAVTVVLAASAVGEALFLALISRQPGGGDATAELVIGASVAAAVALVSSLVILRARFLSLIYAAVAAVLVYPLWYAVAIVGCLLGGCGDS